MPKSMLVRVIGAIVAFIVALAALGQAIEWFVGKTNFVKTGAISIANHYPRASSVAAIVLGAVAGGALMGVGWRRLTQPPKPSAPPATVIVDYQLSKPLPELAVGEQLRILKVTDAGGLDHLVIDTGPQRYRRRSSETLVCCPPYVTVKNKGKDTIQDIELKFIARFYDSDTAPFPGSAEQAPVAVTREYVVPVPILSPNDTFEFIISNWSVKYSVGIAFLETARVRIQGETDAQTVPLMRSQLSDVGGLTSIRLGRRGLHDPTLGGHFKTGH